MQVIVQAIIKADCFHKLPFMIHATPMKCVIIAIGDLDYTEQMARMINKAQLIICAGGGAGHLKSLNIIPMS